MISRAPSSVVRFAAAELSVAILALVYVLAVLPFCPELATRDQAFAVLLNAAPLLVLALGQSFALLIGGIDLSVSGVISLSGVVGAMILTRDDGALADSSLAIPVALLVMLLIGGVAGATQGAAVAYWELPAFIVTMCGMMALGGVAVWLTGGERLGGLSLPLLDAMQGDWLHVPVMLWIAAALAIVCHLLLQHTVLGKHLYAVGHNARAARVAGISLGRVTCFAYGAAGTCSALAALLYTCRTESATPSFAREILLDAIGAAVIGGVSLSGGRVSVVGIVCGALLITLVGNSLTLLNLDYWHVLMAKGGVILVAALLDAARRGVVGGRA
ncbi:MAG: ABC transporter permease [Planctomycetia bacterium]|nr:ABC transporter permease [Planctomycetia bacterium]